MKTTVAPLALLMLPLNAANSQDTVSNSDIENVQVSAKRLNVSDVAEARTVVVPAESATITLDRAITSLPGVQLFRRADSRTAHPTTQGLNMRGVGANAAGRALVTLDGVPVSGPFGGWVFWSALGLQDVAGVQVIKGGSAAAYSPQALAGRVDIQTRFAEKSGGFVKAAIGNRDSYEIGGRVDVVGEGVVFSATAGRADTDGAYLIGADQRGVGDKKASRTAENVSLSTAFESDEGTVLTGRISWFKEGRVNGYDLAVSNAEGVDASLRLVGSGNVLDDYEVTTYYQNRDFAGSFASVRDEARSEIRQVLDQFDVPGEAVGLLGRAKVGDLEFGFDVKSTKGSVAENFRNLGAGFTRERNAGGEQLVAGMFGEYSVSSGDTDLVLSGRLDRYKSKDGYRTEFDFASSAYVREDMPADISGWAPSARLGIDHKITSAITFSSSLYRTWRLPTINEYYRPFRVGNDITEANGALTPEKLNGVDLAISYQPLNTVYLRGGIYQNWLKDGVGNVTIGFGPGFFELGGFVPPGGVLRQRSNIDSMRIRGIELSGKLVLASNLTLSVDYSYADAKVTAFDANTALIGKRPAQTPKHNLLMAAKYDVSNQAFILEGQYQSSLFDDDVNDRLIGSVFTLNGAYQYQVNDALRLKANVENLFNVEVVSALSGTGLKTLAQRRSIWAGVQYSF